MKLFLKKISIYLGVVFGITLLISFCSLYALRQSSFYKPSFLVNDVKQDEFDYIILGASNGLTTLNTIAIDSAIHTNGLNLSMDDTAVSSQLLMLKHFLAEGKRTKYCFLASSPFSFDVKYNNISDNDYRFLMYANRPYVSEYFGSYTSRRANILYFTKWVPTIGVSYYNSELFYPSLLSVVKPKKRNRFDSKGNYVYPVITHKDKQITEFEDVSINFANNDVEKIKALCKENNIQLICYISPMKAKKVIINVDDYQVINHSDLLTNTKYFHDIIHVNYLGRAAASEQFAKEFNRLIQKYNL